MEILPPAHYIITGVGDPAAYADLYKGPVAPYLRYLRSDEMDDPNAVLRDSTTKEISNWMKSRQEHNIQVNYAYMYNLEKYMPRSTSIIPTNVSECLDPNPHDEDSRECPLTHGKRGTFVLLSVCLIKTARQLL